MYSEKEGGGGHGSGCHAGSLLIAPCPFLCRSRLFKITGISEAGSALNTQCFHFLAAADIQNIK